MTAEDLAKQAAEELEETFGKGLQRQTEKVISGDAEPTRSFLTISAEIATVASLLFTVSTYAWDKLRTKKNKEEVTELLEAEFDTVTDLDDEKRKQVISKVVDKLFS